MKVSLRSLLIAMSCWLFFIIFAFTTIKAQNEAVNGIFSISWSPNSKLIAAGNWNGSISVFDALSEENLHTLVGHTDVVLGTAWSPDGTQLASVSSDKTLRIWDVLRSRLLKTASMPSEYATAVIWTPDGKKIITGGVEQTLNLLVWDADTGELLQGFEAGSTVQMKWGPNGGFLVLANPGGGIELRDGKTLELIQFIDDPEMGGQGYDNYQLAWKVDSTQIASGKLNGMLRTWDASKRQMTSTFDPQDSTPISFTTTLITAVAYVNDDTELASISADGTLRIWDISTGHLEQTVQLTDAAYAAAFSTDGSKVAFASADRAMHILSFPLSS